MTHEYDLSAQEIFNKVWDWFVVQKKPRSIRGNIRGNQCAYRGELDGERTCCAVGLFIADEDYHPDMESMSVRELEDYVSVDEDLDHIDAPLWEFLRTNYRLLDALQAAHDSYWDHLTPAAALRVVATRFGLKVPT
jgi:hypothetical protein